LKKGRGRYPAARMFFPRVPELCFRIQAGLVQQGFFLNSSPSLFPPPPLFSGKFGGRRSRLRHLSSPPSLFFPSAGREVPVGFRASSVLPLSREKNGRVYGGLLISGSSPPFFSGSALLRGRNSFSFSFPFLPPSLSFGISRQRVSKSLFCQVRDLSRICFPPLSLFSPFLSDGNGLAAKS